MRKYLILFSLFSPSLFSLNLVQKVLTISTLQVDSIRDLIADQSYEANIETLITYLEGEIGRQIAKIGVDKENPKALAALFLTHTVVNLNTALYAAADAANYDITSVRDAASNSTLNEALHPAWKAAAYATKSAAHGVGKHDCEDAWYKARSAAKETIGQATMLALSNFSFTPMDPRRCRLATLYVLSYITQENFLHEHFIRTYQDIFDALRNKNDVGTSSKEILSIIAQATWNNPQQTQRAPNLFTSSLWLIHNVFESGKTH